ncbi:MAG: HAMP domain-containing sensor histidine kinase [Pseudomonadota bacterium]
MLSGEPKTFIKTFGEFAGERINFAQCAWPCIVLFAGLIALFSGAPPTLAASATLVSILPFFLWLGLQYDNTKIGDAFANLITIAWLLVSFASIAVSGGALSPLTIMLGLGPLTLLTLGRPREGIEAAALSLIAYLAAISLGLAGWADSAPEGWQKIVVPWTIAALLQLFILTWCISGATAETVSSPGEEVPDLPDWDNIDLPILLVEVSSHGRVRHLFGPQELRWNRLHTGVIADDILPSVDDLSFVASDGKSFFVRQIAKANGGRWLALIPDDDNAFADFGSDPDALRRAEVAEAELQERTAFFAGLGHDLKTPLNAILGFADLMRAEVRGPLPDAYKDYPAIIHESGQDLMLLVEDILDLAKSEAKSHRLEVEPVDLVASATSIIRQLEDQAARADVTLTQTGDAEVWAEADPRAVRQIWQNLVSNAVKYSNAGDTVTLSAGELAGTVFLSVKDEGAGMDQADLDRIAAPFAQGDNAKGRAGTGLGLAVVQRFAELHGGRVVIDTAPGKGTRVRVTLPAASSEDVTPYGDAAQ